MFDPTSRYYKIENALYESPYGSRAVYKRRRLPPPASSFTIQATAAVRPGDRLDLIAARTLGDPRQFWRIADANDALQPADLLKTHKRLRIPAVRLPEP